jgi:hypothetical protein
VTGLATTTAGRAGFTLTTTWPFVVPIDNNPITSDKKNSFFIFLKVIQCKKIDNLVL